MKLILFFLSFILAVGMLAGCGGAGNKTGEPAADATTTATGTTEPSITETGVTTTTATSPAIIITTSTTAATSTLTTTEPVPASDGPSATPPTQDEIELGEYLSRAMPIVLGHLDFIRVEQEASANYQAAIAAANDAAPEGPLYEDIQPIFAAYHDQLTALKVTVDAELADAQAIEPPKSAENAHGLLLQALGMYADYLSGFITYHGRMATAGNADEDIYFEAAYTLEAAIPLWWDEVMPAFEALGSD